MSILVETGKNTVMLRRARGLTQEKAAFAANRSPSCWQLVEYGDRNTTIDTLRNVARVLGVAPLALGILSWSDGEILDALRQAPQIPPVPFGEGVALLRKMQGLSQKELAKRAHVSAARLRDMEQGCANVTVAFLKRVAKGLGISLPALGALGLSEDQVLDMVHRAREVIEAWRRKGEAAS